ncbi:copper chaperone PCu(A)C (plasmid) [Roseomonas gilardii subsp. gilardii]|uniref:copper chaperone PCu(A)C n=1 Tax=Roseomonas gilardii TaxID=257708 RepID=UPI001FFB8F5D|nr:copper chaperone PCu(A)C [Roseomonas gilardii]UPG74604.1 copper chaperone PCu(A)C [Roseomonas gilardii subsp. gilardii]
MTLLRRRLLPALFLSPLLPALPARAQQPGSISIEQPWARAAVQGGTGGVFLTIRNTGAAPDRLLSASSPLPHSAELHTTVRDGDVMRMQPVQAIEIPAGGSVTLRPGGLHLMLVGLSAPLRVGEAVPVTLTFEHAGAITVQVPVQAAGATGPHGHS